MSVTSNVGWVDPINVQMKAGTGKRFLQGCFAVNGGGTIRALIAMCACCRITGHPAGAGRGHRSPHVWPVKD
jgi:hypothetical protein